MSGTDKYVYVNATIVGERPILMARMDVETLFDTSVTVKRDKTKVKLTPRETAQKLLYVAEDKRLFFPTTAIARMIREAGGAHKMRGERKAVKFKVPAALLCMEEQMFFHDPDTLKPIVDPNWEVDIRSVVVAKGGRVPSCRPRLDRWAATFSLRINQEVLPDEVLHKLLEDAGEQLGMGAFRPERGGTFGLFRVTAWQKEVRKSKT